MKSQSIDIEKDKVVENGKKIETEEITKQIEKSLN